MRLLLAQEFHDIAPPVDYSVLPAWMVFCAALSALVLVGALALFWQRRRRHTPLAPSAKERALAALGALRGELHETTPYQFSIRVSDVLRRYVSDQFDLPVTRQTSLEFLSSLAHRSTFSETEKSLLGDFLNRCDLLKFGRFDATLAESELLLEEAERFVKGGALEPA